MSLALGNRDFAFLQRPGVPTPRHARPDKRARVLPAVGVAGGAVRILRDQDGACSDRAISAAHMNDR